MIIFLNIVIFLAAIYLQSSFSGHFDFFGFFPNIVLIAMICLSLFRKNYEAYIFAFVFGLALDSLSGGPYGLHVGVFMLTVFLSNVFFSEDDSKLSVPFTSLFTGIVIFFFYLVLAVFITVNTKGIILSTVLFYLGQLGITLLFAMIMLPLARKLFLWENRISAKRRR